MTSEKGSVISILTKMINYVVLLVTTFIFLYGAQKFATNKTFDIIGVLYLIYFALILRQSVLVTKMDDSLNSNSIRSTLIVIFLILIAGLFYWFQYRPAEIRKRCINPDLGEIERMLGGKIDSKEGLPINKLYRICLTGNGLKPEDLVSDK